MLFSLKRLNVRSLSIQRKGLQRKMDEKVPRRYRE